MKSWVSAIASAASILGLAFVPGIPGWGRACISALGIVCLAVLLFSEINAKKINQRICTSEEEIQAAMMQIIKAQGKLCIMSRDLSWVDAQIRNAMKKKHDITIFAEKETELTKGLISDGIQVKYYGKYHFVPKTRFTVIGYNRNHPQVAIADQQHSIRKKGKLKHVIYETSLNNCAQDEWINSLALDIISLCNAVSVENLNENH